MNLRELFVEFFYLFLYSIITVIMYSTGEIVTAPKAAASRPAVTPWY
jgi:hypothetical protein